LDYVRRKKDRLIFCAVQHIFPAMADHGRLVDKAALRAGAKGK
jgi:hypothetical protein